MFSKQHQQVRPHTPSLMTCNFGVAVVRGLSAFGLALALMLTTWVGSAGAQTGFQMRTQLVEGRILPGSSFAAGYDAAAGYTEDITIADADTETGAGGVAEAILSSYADGDGRAEGSNVGIVDWVEVEFVAIPAGDTLNISPIPAASATVSRYKKVALLLSDGSIADPGILNEATSQYELSAMLTAINDGSQMPTLTVPSGDDGLGDVEGKDIYVIVNHQNHIAILSSGPTTLDGEDHTYDFTTGFSQAEGEGSALTEATLGANTEFAMFGGDATQDGVNVDVADRASIIGDIGAFGYHSNDFSLDGNVIATDAGFAQGNIGASRQFTP